MSMLDSFFRQGFKGAKCKTLLKLTIPRIKLLRNRREIQIKQMRKDIAKLLETGQEATARIRVEHIIREENMMAAQEILELFCELIAVRLPIIETQRECPLDLKEAISSVCFAAPRCADLPELQQVQMLFASKYGKEFVAAAAELMPDCGVNRQIIELLSIRAPQAEKKLKLLKEIAEEHDLDWDPAASETEFLKPHEDLLNGPSQFVSASKQPLPKENNDEPIEASNGHSDSDQEWDSLDLPEVPKVSLRTTPNNVSAPEVSPGPSYEDSEHDHELRKSSGGGENTIHEPKSETETIVRGSSVASPNGSTNAAADKREDKQFLPFISSPSMSSASFAFSDNEPTSTLSSTKYHDKSEDHTHISATKGASQSEAYVDLQDVVPTAKTSVKKIKDDHRNVENMDLQDVLAAAQAAADSAERAAAAARSAASLAQITITELIKRRNDQASDNSELSEHAIPTALPQFDHQQSFNNDIGASYSLDHPPQDHGSSWRSEPQDLPSYDSLKEEFAFPRTDDHVIGSDSSHHQPQRLSSIEQEDAYFSYPNLFTSAASNTTPGAHPSSDNSPSSRDA